MRVLRTGFICLLLVATYAFSAFGGYIVANVNLIQLQYSPYTMTSAGSAFYYDSFSNQVPADLSGIHAIRGDNNTTPAAETVSGSNGQWAGTLGGIAGAAGVCYRARVDASGSGASQGVGSSLACYAAPPPPPPPPPADPTGGDGGSGPGGPIGPGDDGGGPGTQLECIPGVDVGCGITSPIVINLDNGQYQLTGEESTVLFDITGTGTKLPIGWTAAGTNQAFLWMDRDHDGVVSGGAELFGTATVLKNGHRASNGFEALREFDTNGDLVIDANDSVWTQLLLWTDRNHDGISQPSEVTRLADSPVRSISLTYHWTGRRDAHGNTFRYEGLISLSTSGGSRQKPVYDIFFVLDTTKTTP
jgi:hypothetical protein